MSRDLLSELGVAHRKNDFPGVGSGAGGAPRGSKSVEAPVGADSCGVHAHVESDARIERGRDRFATRIEYVGAYVFVVWLSGAQRGGGAGRRLVTVRLDAVVDAVCYLIKYLMTRGARRGCTHPTHMLTCVVWSH